MNTFTQTPPALLPDEEEQIRQTTRTLISGLAEGSPDRSLISVLQLAQEAFGYLPAPALLEIAADLDIPPARVYGVATFYNQFRFTPPGRTVVRICMGTACAIKQGGVILQAWERRLGIAEGGTTEDREFSLERVACVGCCSLAPVALVGERVHAHMTPTKVDGLLLQHQLAAERKGPVSAQGSAPSGAEEGPSPPGEPAQNAGEAP